jgi:hypothetical protein
MCCNAAVALIALLASKNIVPAISILLLSSGEIDALDASPELMPSDHALCPGWGLRPIALGREVPLLATERGWLESLI